MHQRGKINVLVHSFLGSFVSRNADYGGYWLHGFLAMYPAIPVFDLLNAPQQISYDPVFEYSHHLARKVFEDLAAKIGVRRYVKSALLEIRRVPASQEVWTLAHRRQGYRLIFTLAVVDDRRRKYERVAHAIAAAHDPVCELRRAE